MAKGIYVGVETQLVQGDIIPKVWTEVTKGTEYVAEDGTRIAASGYNTTQYGNGYVSNACDGDTNTGFMANPYNQAQTFDVIFPEPKKITKIKGIISQGGNWDYAEIRGSKNGTTWTTLHTLSKSGTGAALEEIELENVDYYKYYRVYAHFSTTGTRTYLYIEEFQTSEYEDLTIAPKGIVRKVKKAYVGVDSKARKIKKGYIGVGGIARLFYSSEQVLSYYGRATDLPKAREGLAATSVGDYALFAGGNNDGHKIVDTYTSSLVKGTASNLSAEQYTAKAITVGNYALIGGGQNSNGQSQATVDTYTSSLVKGTATGLSVARRDLAATSVGNYALFGGGYDGNYSGVVDTYNTSLAKGTATNLSVGRNSLVATSVGNFALFGGGVYGTKKATVDTYTSSLVKGTATGLSVAKQYLAATSVGNYALFGGGYTDNGYTATVDTYTSSLVKGTATGLSVARRQLAATSVGNYALFGGGYDGNYSGVVDTYNTSLAKGTATNLSVGRLVSATSIGTYALFAGGYKSGVGYIGNVDVYQVA